MEKKYTRINHTLLINWRTLFDNKIWWQQKSNDRSGRKKYIFIQYDKKWQEFTNKLQEMTRIYQEVTGNDKNLQKITCEGI